MSLSAYFRRHGQLCASHQWEVIVSVATFTICMLTVNQRSAQAAPPPIRLSDTRCHNAKEYLGADAVVMTTVRCVALLYTYHQFRKLRALRSNYILGLAGLFTVISTAVFTSSIINFMHSSLSDLKDALFLLLLLTDLSKVTRLAQYALAAAGLPDVEVNIGRGMQLLGPQLTLDVLVEVLLISVGTLSGVYRLEVLCCYACLSALVNYVMFMTFYPALLSLVLQMWSGGSEEASPPWRSWSLVSLLHEDQQKPNVVIQRVKVIMSIGLSFVHFVSRWPSAGSEAARDPILGDVADAASCDAVAPSPYGASVLRWLSVSAESLVVLIIVLALVGKYLLFEKPDEDRKRRQAEQRDTTIGRALRPQLRRRCTSVLITEDSDGEVRVDELPPRAASSHAHVQTATPGDADAHFRPASQAGAVGVRATTSAADAQCEPAQAGDAGSEVATEEGAAGQVEEVEATLMVEAPQEPRHLEQCVRIMKESGAAALSDAELLQLLASRQLRPYQLEAALADAERAVHVRRQHLALTAGGLADALDQVPFRGYEYARVLGACCENVVGYVPLPLGVVGPLQLDGTGYHVPLATTEGALVASTNRGCLATRQCGISSFIVGDGMTRAPLIECPSAKYASSVLEWLQTNDGFHAVKSAFDATSRFARLKNAEVSMFGRQLFVRFVARTGDAMGMNMVSKGSEAALDCIRAAFPQVVITSVSSNVCTDKKPSAINWARGRGRSVICEAVVPAAVVSSVLKTSVPALVNLAIKKNLVGSAVAGSIGGNNAHAANIVTAIYIATGQDAAQNVGSSSCMTLLEPWGADGQDLYVTCTMPCLEVGTVGGGTSLTAQRACLAMLGCHGPHAEEPGRNAQQLARIVCATVLAGELSLLAAQSAGSLVKSHMILNRNAAAPPTRQ